MDSCFDFRQHSVCLAAQAEHGVKIAVVVSQYICIRALLRTLCCLVCFSFSSSSSLFKCMLSLHITQQIHVYMNVHEETNARECSGGVM